MAFRASRSYFDLYAHTARDLKKRESAAARGRPGDGGGSLGRRFSEASLRQNHVPVDFVSTHGYADDTVEDLFGTNEEIPMDDRVCRAVAKVRDEIKVISPRRIFRSSGRNGTCKA